MDMSFSAINAIWRPSFLFDRQRVQARLQAGFPSEEVPPPSPSLSASLWESSALNPKNRVDSLPEAGASRWRIDGAATFKTRFFVVPLDLLETDQLPPLRIDVFLPDQVDYPPALRETLEAASGVPVQNAASVAALGISRYLSLILDKHCARNRDFLDKYRRLPFGSSLLIRSLVPTIDQVDLLVEPNYYLEQKATSLPVLRRLWATDIADDAWPPTMDIFQLSTVRQIHDTVTLVRIRECRVKPELQGQLAIFKSGTDEFDHVLHELKFLLRLPRHPNIVDRPIAIITKKCGFGGKQGVFGFLIPYMPAGSIRDILPEARRRGTLDDDQKLSWCRQVTAALVHVWEAGGTFYSDLRPDNVLLASAGSTGSYSQPDRLVLCDFEQRGNWHEWCPPEILYPQYLENLRSNRRRFRDASWDRLIASFTEYRPVNAHETFVHSKNRPWFSLSRGGQEKAMSFCLGLFMYCVFEGLSTVQPSMPYSFPLDPEIAFPEFRSTPPPVRELIRWCTVDAAHWRDKTVSVPRRVVRVRGRLYPDDNLSLDADTKQTAGIVLNVAQESWENEIEQARLFFDSEQWQTQTFGAGRPTLREVRDALAGLRDKLGSE
ncbi:hypothetical protein B0T22DRAFT_433759 [Podospora appendiculata]|uniref:Protein kinase domain-containing protein n=1 Tax=Podospora appendiculata TaxID=314037 RepID=A0AAE1C8L9_9PEZI|nr:hypothetical protein B0T22DRAFT_433759 [Podospora appendiculata]